MGCLEKLTEEIRNKFNSLKEIPEVTFAENIINKLVPIFENYWNGKCVFYNRTFIVETSQGHYAIMPNQYFYISKIMFDLAQNLRVTFDDFDENFRNDKELRTIINTMQDLIKKGNLVSVKEHLLQKSQKINSVFSSLPTERLDNLCYLLGNLKDSKKFGNTEKDTFRTSADLFGSYLLNVAPLTTAESGSFGDLMYVLTSNIKVYKELSDSLKEVKTITFATNKNNVSYSYNRILFGAPGTGKSNTLKEQADTKFAQDAIERVTFHPNYSYAQFVGTYKPISKLIKKEENGKQIEFNEISYEYVSGPFIKTWIKAYKSGQPQLLIIEEINRANVAAVFGDTFQLLDRNPDGESEYPITISNDLKRYLSEEEGINIDTMTIPENMYIWATMNSADQGVFPMDAAFKRRWNFEYLPIDYKDDEVENFEVYYGEGFPKSVPEKKDNELPEEKSERERVIEENKKYSLKWNMLRKAINDLLKDNVDWINEDKLLGPWFIKPDGDDEITISSKNFCNKVLMYLYEDVVKIDPSKIFNKEEINKNGSQIFYSDIADAWKNKGVGIFANSKTGNKPVLDIYNDYLKSSKTASDESTNNGN